MSTPTSIGVGQILARQAAGSRSRYFVAILDADRTVVRRLSHFTDNISDALAALRLARLRHPAATLMHRLELTEEVIA